MNCLWNGAQSKCGIHFCFIPISHMLSENNLVFLLVILYTKQTLHDGKGMEVPLLFSRWWWITQVGRLRFYCTLSRKVGCVIFHQSLSLALKTFIFRNIFGLRLSGEDGFTCSRFCQPCVSLLPGQTGPTSFPQWTEAFCFTRIARLCHHKCVHLFGCLQGLGQVSSVC